MEFTKAKIAFESRITTPNIDRVVDSAGVLDALLEKGIDVLRVVWEGLFDEELFVEDDAILLIDGFNELIVSPGLTRHNVDLGDGRLVINTSIGNEHAAMRVRITPFLDAENSETLEVVISEQEYRCRWNAMAGTLLSVANAGGE